MLSRVARLIAHPSRLHRALRRRRFSARLRRVPVHPRESLEKLGSEACGWVVPVDLIDSSWTCWCVGAGPDVCVELHDSVPARQAVALVERLRGQGYTLVHREDPADLTFIAQR